jgi:DNA-binding transcriptional ArsR family regulator
MSDTNNENIASILSLNKLIHEPARLAIMTALMNAQSGDFTFLLNVTNLTKGNLSSHLDKLEQGGLVTIQKRFIGKIPNTFVSLTDEGKSTILQYWKTIENLGKQINT